MISLQPERRALRSAAARGPRLAAIAGVLTLAVLGAGCARNRVRTELIPVPAVGCAECLSIIEGILDSFNPKAADPPVVLSMRADAAEGNLAVTFSDRRVHVVNLVAALNAAGFDAGGRPGAPDARRRLPGCCR